MQNLFKTYLSGKKNQFSLAGAVLGEGEFWETKTGLRHL